MRKFRFVASVRVLTAQVGRKRTLKEGANFEREKNCDELMITLVEVYDYRRYATGKFSCHRALPFGEELLF
jgi:hypothetical protein